MTNLEALHAAIAADPGDILSWQVLADALEEQGEAERAELLRVDLALRGCGHGEERRPLERQLQALLRQGVRPAVPTCTVPLDSGGRVVLSLALIPPGSFLMGCPEGESGFDDEKPQHRVTLTRGFWLGIYPVTQAQWQAVLGSNPSARKGEDRPVESVSWDDCAGFCSELSVRTGRHFALPTEAQWEYACRAGTTTPFFFGEDASALAEFAWYRDSSGDTSHPVGQKKPNPWGLYDMLGGIWEWCSGWRDDYPGHPVTDPESPTGRYGRIMRGSSWKNDTGSCRVAFRCSHAADSCRDYLGCRVLMRLG